MKKVLVFVLAGVLTLGMSVTAFAGSGSSGITNGNQVTSGTGSVSGTAIVNAKFNEDKTIKATVSWGNMNFVYDEPDTAWEIVANGNKVTVQNDSTNSNYITPTFRYTDGTSDSFTEVPMLFTTSLNSFNVTSGDASEALDITSDSYSTSSIAPNASSDVYLMFTSASTANTLSQTDFDAVGTLTITLNKTN
ncbi:MAG: hypothetical protein IKF90_25960 [Parasporobacterium sp.]|nr:hypothetical protein [Parasporobacterium sp.]